ncbi:hypothetical protein BDV96DRAFT_649849 [Lophiotrema nucula]|uniref:Zn(2)-C6 fungal-type domain-containing protein n=1 Tax=Lophiotrema nucula TaxID=690887 RepID=A0A6A5Z0L3_9PLEO|nr:hypothetical protein BDV96DRAFT_649849 [Lophiotrema nucula]
MPAERRSATNHQGRQRSCSECAKSKRRCDLRQPSCIRCSRQDLACVYPPPPTATSSSTPIAGYQNESSSSAMGNVEELFRFDAPFDPVPAPSAPEVEVLDFDFSSGMDSADALNDMLFNQTEDIDKGLALINSYYVAGKGWSAENFSAFARSRLEYVMGQFENAPRSFIDENRTPWCHPLLYEDGMPRCLQDAHAACALYLARNDLNGTFVTRHTMGRLDELLDSPKPDGLTDVMARSHSLMLYQIMLAFSSDMRYTRYNDSVDAELEWNGRKLHNLLLTAADPVGPIQIYPCGAAHTIWKDFIVRESARRTLLCVFHMLAMIHLMSGKYHSCKDIQLSSRVSLSGLLWQAESPFDFTIAWNENNPHFVDDLDYTDLLETARPEEIDAFGRMLLTSTMGIDDVKGWFHTRGGTF